MGLGRVRTRERLKRVEGSSLKSRLAKPGSRHGAEFDRAVEHDSPPCTPHSSFHTLRVNKRRKKTLQLGFGAGLLFACLFSQMAATKGATVMYLRTTGSVTRPRLSWLGIIVSVPVKSVG
jgi:hypothetical protein